MTDPDPYRVDLTDPLTRAFAAEDKLALSEVHVAELQARVAELERALQLREVDVDTLGVALDHTRAERNALSASQRQLLVQVAEMVGQVAELAAVVAGIRKDREGGPETGPGATQSAEQAAGAELDGDGPAGHTGRPADARIDTTGRTTP